VLDGITDVASDVLKSPPFEAGGTFIVRGAPGAGKTSLARELSKRLKDKGIGFVFCEDPTSDKRIDDLCWDIAGALTGHSDEELRTEYRKSGAGGFNFGVVQVGGGVAEQVRGDSGDAPESIKRLNWLNKENSFMTPVVVFLDEAQNIKSGSKAESLATMLHTQSSLPILLVCAGLSNTQDALHSIGISRSTLRHVYPIGALSAAETYESAHRSLQVIQETGADGTSDDVRAWSETLAHESDNWPRHLTCYLQAVLESLIKQDRPNISELDRGAALSLGRTYREGYYAHRLASSELPVSIIADLYGELEKDSLSRLECEGALEEMVERYTGRGARIVQRKFSDGSYSFNALLRAGIITAPVDPTEPCEIPIPSMLTFIIEKAREERARHALRTHLGLPGRD